MIPAGAFVIGLAAFAAGVWWIYPPAALIAVGGLTMASAWFYVRGGRTETE